MKVGDLVTGDKFTTTWGRNRDRDIGLVLKSSPTIGTDIRMLDIMWSSGRVELCIEKRLILINEAV